MYRRLVPARARRVSPDEAGSTAIEISMVLGLTLFFLLVVANLIVDLYGMGAVHTAVDEGARAGARANVDSVQACDTRAREVLRNLLGGRMGNGVTLTCAESAGVVEAHADASFPAWVGFPDMSFSVRGQALKEMAPT
jgi:hypothetical protein